MRRDKAKKQVSEAQVTLDEKDVAAESYVDEVAREVESYTNDEIQSDEPDFIDIVNSNFVEEVESDNDNMTLYFQPKSDMLDVTLTQTSESVYKVNLLIPKDKRGQPLMTVLLQQKWSLFSKSEEAQKSLRTILAKYLVGVQILSMRLA